MPRGTRAQGKERSLDFARDDSSHGLKPMHMALGPIRMTYGCVWRLVDGFSADAEEG